MKHVATSEADVRAPIADVRAALERLETGTIVVDLTELGPDATHVTLTRLDLESSDAAARSAQTSQAMLEALQHEFGSSA